MTTTATFNLYPASKAQQRGAVLFIVMAFLVVFTLLGLSLFGVTSDEEKMARNFRDAEKAHEAAEAALRDAEIRIDGFYAYVVPDAAPTPISQLAFSQACTNGLCEESTTQPAYTLLANTGNGVRLGDCPGGCRGDTTGGTGTSTPEIMGVAAQPRYLIEKIMWTPSGVPIDEGLPAYRITALGVGRNVKTEVLLQEVYVSPPTW